MIFIPAGEFLMGSTPQQDEPAFDHEQPQHRLFLPDYYLGKTLVTNAQYNAFVLVTGHGALDDRTSEAHLPLLGAEDHPVVNVSWYDARDYCQWLSAVTGRSYGLPSEAEWEKGARGTDGRIYPWGNNWDAARCNLHERDLYRATSVQSYPQGASPYGVLDMAGNVWEWTRSLWGDASDKRSFKYPYDSTDGRENIDALDYTRRSLRGGSFLNNRRIVRCAYGGKSRPSMNGKRIGFRVVMHP
jgi:formylglycine-generating enzyme required for sulfatase activity